MIKLKTIKDIKGKRVTIFGLGLQNGGVGAARFFAKNGANVIVTDIKKEEDLKPSIEKLKGLNIEYVLGKHMPENFIETDLVIKNPAIPPSSPYLKIAQDNNVLVETDITIFFRFCPAPIIGITGTKGKSTTAALTTVLAGNIGQSVLDFLPQINSNTFVILELSSAQLEDLKNIKISPHIAALTNIFQDHLNRHGDFESYQNAKKNIFKFQDKNDFLVLNFDNKDLLNLASDAKSKIYVYSQKFDLRQSLSPLSRYNAGVYIADNKLLFGQEGQLICSLEQLNIFGSHNIENLLCAATIGLILGVNLQKLPKYLADFKWLKYRLTLEKESDGISFYNDTCATNPTATLKSLETIINKFGSKNVALILGGEDKKLDYQVLISFIEEKLKGAIFLIPGSGTDKIFQSINNIKNPQFQVTKTTDLEQAIEKAVSFLKESGGGALLFSPACASFNAYKNEFDRGEHFTKIIEKF